MNNSFSSEENTMSNTDKTLEKWLEILPEPIRSEFKQRLFKTLNYEPKIGIMGKSGAGKSSLINAILGKKACETGGVGGCTRAFQKERININGKWITFIDLPGVAENKERDDEYGKLYAERITEDDLDLILWVIKVDDRANKNDEEFYEELIEFYDKKRVLFVLSQCDKAEPTRDFDYSKFKPSEKQLDIIKQNQQRLSKDFNVTNDYVIPVACEYYDEKFNNWNIPELITRIIESVPAEKATAIYRSIARENINEQTREKTKSAFRETADKIFDAVIDYIPVPELVKKGAKALKNTILNIAEGVFDFLFG